MRKYRKGLSAILAFSMILATSVSASEIKKPTQIVETKINGIASDVMAFDIIIDGENKLVPLRLMGKVLDFKLVWNKEDQSIALDDGVVKSKITIGKDFYYKESSTAMGLTRAIELGSAPIMKAGEAYVPISFFNLLYSDDNALVIKDNVLEITKKDKVSVDVTKEQVTDYSKGSNWLAADITGTKAVDVFYIYPTSYQKGPNDPNYCAVNHLSMVKGAIGSFNRQATAFLPAGNIYAPYYRQADAGYVLGMPTIEEQDEVVRVIPAADGMAAFQYYLEHYNNGKPFILAGHSQGSMILLSLLSELKNQPEVYERMVAAYVIGFSVTEDYLKQNPHLKFAQGADDTGVIISYNTQAEGITDNPVVRPGAMSINPISWTLTDAPALKETNAGSITPLTVIAADLAPVKNQASAQIDTKKGVVVCNTVDIDQFSMAGWPRGVYHSYDYPFYYYNIQENALNRVQKYLKK